MNAFKKIALMASFVAATTACDNEEQAALRSRITENGQLKTLIKELKSVDDKFHSGYESMNQAQCDGLEQNIFDKYNMHETALFKGNSADTVIYNLNPHGNLVTVKEVRKTAPKDTIEVYTPF